LSFFLLALWLISATAIAKDDILVNCGLTPNVAAPEHYPGAKNIPASNDLRRKTGSAEVANGKMIRLIGRVVDENCVPVADAKVEIWQPNSYGYYRDEAEKIDEVNDVNFQGAGEFITNNLGQFDFVSIKPGSLGWRAPQINFKVAHPDFDEVNTTIYFEDESRTDFDPVYSKLPLEVQKSLIARKRLLDEKNPAETAYYFDITLRGASKTKSY